MNLNTLPSHGAHGVHGEVQNNKHIALPQGWGPQLKFNAKPCHHCFPQCARWKPSGAKPSSKRSLEAAGFRCKIDSGVQRMSSVISTHAALEEHGVRTCDMLTPEVGFTVKEWQHLHVPSGMEPRNSKWSTTTVPTAVCTAGTYVRVWVYHDRGLDSIPIENYRRLGAILWYFYSIEML